MTLPMTVNFRTRFTSATLDEKEMKPQTALGLVTLNRKGGFVPAGSAHNLLLWLTVAVAASKFWTHHLIERPQTGMPVGFCGRDRLLAVCNTKKSSNKRQHQLR